MSATWTLPAGRDLAGLCAALEVSLDASATPWSLWDAPEPCLIPAGVALWTFPSPAGPTAVVAEDASRGTMSLRLARAPGVGAWCRAGPTRSRIDGLRGDRPLRPLLEVPTVGGGRSDGRVRVWVRCGPVPGLHDAVQTELRVERAGSDAIAWRSALRRFGAVRGRPPIAALVDAVGAWRFGVASTALDAWAPMTQVARAGLAPALRALVRAASHADADAAHVWVDVASETRVVRWFLKALGESTPAAEALVRRVRRLQEVADAQMEGRPDPAHRAVATWHRKGEAGRLTAAVDVWLGAAPAPSDPAWIEVRRWIYGLASELSGDALEGGPPVRARRKAAKRLVWLARWFECVLHPGAGEALRDAATAVLEDADAERNHRGHDREEARAMHALAQAVSLAMGDPSAAWAAARSTAPRR
jgi:hypothetical protein